MKQQLSHPANQALSRTLFAFGGLQQLWCRGRAGSPIFFDPLFPPGSDITAGEPRAMLIGLQSISVGGGDLAGMTRAKYLIEVISRSVGSDADFTLGTPSR